MAEAKERHERLREARLNAGFRSAAAAARRLGIAYGTYINHEGGFRGIQEDELEKYARVFKVTVPWLAFGMGKKESYEDMQIPVVGYVGAGAMTHLFEAGQGPFDYIDAPPGSTDKTVAVEIRGESLGSFFDRWLVLYDDVRDPPTRDLLNRMCVIGLHDGRVLIKKLVKGSTPGTFTLLSQFESPIFDVPIAWAARVKNMVPR